MATILHQTVREYVHNEGINKRFLRSEDAMEYFSMNLEELMIFASAAGAVYKFSRIVLISKKRLEEYMKHIYKVPNSGKYVQKKLVRVGEGSIIYSIGHHRFIEMAKAITIIELKLEGQLIKRHPEYNMSNRLFLESIDYEKGTVQVAGKEYVLKDSNFPTIDPKAPYTLTPEEESLVMTLKHSFLHSAKLQKHIRFLYSHGSMYKVCNNNLLFHGCIPMNEKGEFICWEKEGRTYSGRALMDYLEKKIIDAYFLDEFDNKEKKKDALDLMWYLWAGPDSPLFGKDKMTTFEHIFINEPELSVENYNPYYEFSKEVEYCDRIFDDFGMSNKNAHIINGHVPVKVASGEHPVKADGKLYVIDGGLSKAYHSTTGIAGYTLIFNSRHLALAEHKEYVPDGDNTPKIQVTEVMEHRLLVKDTDYGKAIRVQIQDLIELKECYNLGLIKEK